MVFVNSGEYRGKQGRVLEVFPDKQKAIVEGVNIVSKHTKPNSKNPQGGIVKVEAAIHVSKLNPVCPTTGKPTRIGRARNEKGWLQRFSIKAFQKEKKIVFLD